MKTQPATALAAWLAEQGISHSDFAARVGADRVQVWRWAKGDRKPGLEAAVAIEKETKGAVPVSAWTEQPSPKRRPAA